MQFNEASNPRFGKGPYPVNATDFLRLPKILFPYQRVWAAKSHSRTKFREFLPLPYSSPGLFGESVVNCHRGKLSRSGVMGA